MRRRGRGNAGAEQPHPIPGLEALAAHGAASPPVKGTLAWLPREGLREIRDDEHGKANWPLQGRVHREGSPFAVDESKWVWFGDNALVKKNKHKRNTRLGNYGSAGIATEPDNNTSVGRHRCKMSVIFIFTFIMSFLLWTLHVSTKPKACP